MSATAEIHIIPRSALNQLTEVASDDERYRETLASVSTDVFVYDYSGWILATLLPVLSSEFGIDLMTSDQQLATQLTQATSVTHVLLTSHEKETYSQRLQATAFEAAKLRKSFEEFNATDAPEAEEFMPDGIRFLKAGLDRLTPDTVGILKIG
jgi:hypothetical protein